MMHTAFERGYADGFGSFTPDTRGYIFDRDLYLEGYTQGSIARENGELPRWNHPTCPRCKNPCRTNMYWGVCDPCNTDINQQTWR